jgi:hypothetical protein
LEVSGKSATAIAMNRHEPTSGEAKLRYLDADYQVVVPGQFVVCAQTGQQIPIGQLRYWSVDRQEAYVSAGASLAREQAIRQAATGAPE